MVVTERSDERHVDCREVSMLLREAYRGRNGEGAGGRSRSRLLRQKCVIQ